MGPDPPPGSLQRGRVLYVAGLESDDDREAALRRKSPVVSKRRPPVLERLCTPVGPSCAVRPGVGTASGRCRPARRTGRPTVADACWMGSATRSR